MLTEGIPILRPMFMEFPEDRACETLDIQYMLGDSFNSTVIGKRESELLPPGRRWTNYLTGEVINGERFQRKFTTICHCP